MDEYRLSVFQISAGQKLAQNKRWQHTKSSR